MNIYNRKTITDVLKIFNPSALYKKIYLSLDSRNALIRTDSKITWYLSDIPTTTSGSVNVKSALRNIVGMRVAHGEIYGSPLPLPHLPGFQSAKTALPVQAITQYDESTKRITFYIEEFKNNAYLSTNGIKYHFVGYYQILTYVPIGVTYEWVPFDYQICKLDFGSSINKGEYWFNQPVALNNTLTMLVSDYERYLYVGISATLPCTYISHTTTMMAPIQISYITGTVIAFMNINFRITEFRYPVRANAAYRLRAIFPDITTTNPVADAQWIAYMRSTYIMYQILSPTVQQVYRVLVTVLPVGTIVMNTINISPDVTVRATVEMIYLDTVL